MHHKILILFLFLITGSASAQLSDLARIDFTFIPNKNSDVEYTRSRVLINAPIPLKGDGTYLFLGFD